MSWVDGRGGRALGGRGFIIQGWVFADREAGARDLSLEPPGPALRLTFG
jgi:hypothetical protein